MTAQVDQNREDDGQLALSTFPSYGDAPSPGNTTELSTSSRPMTLRQQLEAHRVLEDTIITDDGHEKVYHVQFEENELLALCQEIAREAVRTQMSKTIRQLEIFDPVSVLKWLRAELTQKPQEEDHA